MNITPEQREKMRLGRERRKRWQEEGGNDAESTFSPTEYNPVSKNIGNSSSLRTAINAQCAHCQGCTETHTEPNFRNEIRDCSAPKCPLFSFRPYK